jgi:RimJ/RimL family protein N-acetyltransferase
MVLIGNGCPALGRLEPGDGELLHRFFFRLSPESRYRRFLSPVARPEQVNPERLLDVDHREREAVCALVDGEIVGVARYTRIPGSDSAEVAVAVADAWQRQGIGTRLVTVLAEHAAEAGLTGFAIFTHSDNRGALALLHRLRPDARLARSGALYETTVVVGRDDS